MIYILKKGDTKTRFTFAPTIDGVPVLFSDLTGATLSFLMKGVANNGTPVATKKAAVITGSGSNPAGFQYDPDSADVSLDGTFRQEWEVVYSTGKIQTFPTKGYNVVEIQVDLG